MNKTQRDIEQINTLFAKFNLSVSSYSEGARVNEYRVKFPCDMEINKLLKLQKNLVAALHDNNVIIRQDEDEIVIETKGNGNILHMDDVFLKSMYNRTSDFRLVLGQDISNHNTTTLLPKAPHMLVSGCTGSGKTQLLHCFIASLLLGTTAHHLILIDPKGNEFNVYKDIDTVQFVDNAAEGIKVLQWLVTEMNARYEIMAKEGASDVSKSRFTRIVCVIDEFADLIKTDREIEKYVVLIAQKARACGIHLIIATQYPKAEVLTGLIQANIPTRICLKVSSNVQSRIALGFSGGEKLLGHGDMFYLGNGMYEPMRIQAPYISDEDKLKVVEIAKAQLKGLNGNISKTPITPKEPERVSYEHLVHPKQEQQEPPKKKRVGLIQGLRNIMNSPQCTTAADLCAMDTAHRWTRG